MADKQTDPPAPPAAPTVDPPAPPQPFLGTIRPMTPEEIRLAAAAEQARIVAEVEARDAMNGPEGGRYLVGGQMVNAEGEPIKDKR